MARRCSMKLYGSQKLTGGLNRIPKELLTEILSHVASGSCADLFSFQQTCKSLYEAGSDRYVLSHATMKELEFLNWNSEKSSSMAFLNRLKQSENSEALFRHGMIAYFSETKAEEGLELLKRAAEKGHDLAMYVYGVILVCYGDSDRENGLHILHCLGKKGKSRDMVVGECRKQINPLVAQLWINHCIVGSGPDDEDLTSRVCRNGCILQRNKRGWRADDEVESSDFCHTCFWDREAKKFCNMLLKSRFEF